MMTRMLRQTAMLSAAHFLVRSVGFVLRIWLSRHLGAQVMGLVELAGSAQSLLITPVVSGLPAALSRMCAKANTPERTRILRMGVFLALAGSLPLSLLAFALRRPLALWLGDIRTLPALMTILPCIPVLGVSCVLNGYYYGCGRPAAPAAGELLEQAVRFTLCLCMVTLMRAWPAPLLGAIPSAAALMGETASLLLMVLLSLRVLLLARGAGSRRAMLFEMLSLALPLTGMKLVSSLMRTVNTTLIPARLQASGLPAGEALTQLGMMNSMMMPVLMLPSFITCSLSMVSSPELARRQAQGRPIMPLITKILKTTLLLGTAAMAAVYLFAPIIAGTLYRQAELLPLLRRCCALVPVMALNQVLGGTMNGLGMQRLSLRISLVCGFVCVLLMYLLTALPHLRLYGAILSMAAGQLLTLALNLRALYRQGHSAHRKLS